MHMRKENIEPARKIEVTRNHYVPRSYISLFQNENGKIRTLKQNSGEVFWTNVSNVGVEKDLYTAKDILGEKSYESFYTNYVDFKYSYTIRKLVSNAKLVSLIEKPLEVDNIKMDLAEIIVTQIMRVPEVIYSKKDTYERVIRRVEHSFRDFLKLHPESKKIVNTYLEDEKYYKGIMLNIVNDLDRIRRYSSVLYAKTWVLYHNVSKVKFITSDNPIVRYNFKYDKLGVPISGEQAFIGFPLTPEYYLTIIPNDYLLGCVQVAEDRCYEIGEESSQTIQFWNQLQKRNAIQFTYGEVYRK